MLNKVRSFHKLLEEEMQRREKSWSTQPLLFAELLPTGFRLTRDLIKSVIADMDLDPDSLSQAEEAFISAGLLWKPLDPEELDQPS